MRYIVLTFVAVAAIGLTEAALGKIVAIDLVIYGKVEKNCPGYGEKRIEAQKCFMKYQAEETLCSLLKKYHSKCMIPLIDHLESCLPKDTKYFPEFASKTLDNVVEYACHNDGEHIFEFFNTCIRDPTEQAIKANEKCIDLVKTNFEQYMDGIPSKTTLCRTILSLKTCAASYVNSTCKNHITRESFIGLYDALTHECENLSSVEVDKNEIGQ